MAAWGNKTTVFALTDENINCLGDCKFNEEFGTKWYRTGLVWGFLRANDPLYSQYSDIGDGVGPHPWTHTSGTRLSIAINSWNGVGGYRCGANTRLYYSNEWERVFFHANTEFFI